MQPLEVTPIEAPPPASGAPAAPFEFNAQQNEVMAALGQAMHDVGRLLGAIGILSIVVGIARLFAGGGVWERALTAAVWSLLQGGIFLVIGVWTRDAGEQLRRVATTTGADLQHLMEAMVEMRQVYSLARLVMTAALAALVLAMLLFLTRSAL